MTCTESNACGMRFAVCGSYPTPRNPEPPHPAPRTPQAASRSRGSVLILVVTVLVLMLLIGLAYVQTARTDRLSTAGVSNNIDQVVNAEVARLLGKLQGDLVSSTGVFLDNAQDREPMDYPVTGTTYGTLDDAWLASSSVDSATTKWGHLTNIANGFLNSGGTIVAGNDTAITAGVYSSGTNWTSIATTDCNADADDDGITDSKYTNSAVQWISGVRYVTAIRVIDLSAMVNINTGLLQVDASGSLDALTSGYEPRWWYPSELDFAGWVKRDYAPNWAAFSSEIVDLLNYRDNGAALDWTGRRAFWENGVMGGAGAWFASPYQSVGSPGNEVLLRYRNGLNSPSSIGQINGSTMLQGLMRDASGTTVEAKYSNTPYNTSIYQYLSQEPRHQMTVSSGGIPYRLPLTGDTLTTPGNLKKDINLLSADNLAIEIKRVLDAMPGTPGMTFVPPDALTGLSKEQYAAAFAASIKDYGDNDNQLTGVQDSVSGTTYYGMETLPFVTEAYRQRVYKGQWVQTDFTAGSEQWTLTWKRNGSATGYAIEFRNPFPADTIDLSHVWIRFGGNAATDVHLNTLTGLTTLAVGQSITVYHKSGDGSGAHDDVGAIITGTSKEYTPQISEFENSEPRVELLAETAGGVKIVYQKLALGAFDDGSAEVPVTGVAVVTNPTAPAAPVAGDPGYMGYRQVDNFGNGNGINMMTVTDLEFKAAFDENDDGGKPMDVAGTDNYKTDFDALGDADKTAKTGAPANRVVPAKNQIVIANDADGKIRLIGDLAMIAAIGPRTSPDKTVADVWNGYNEISPKLGAAGFMLNFDDTNLVNTAAPMTSLPYAVVLMDRFTTMRYDGQDRNGDNLTNTADAFIPGQINLNTVSEEMLKNLLPIPDNAVRERIAKLIIAYRDCADATSISGPNFSDGKRGTGIDNYRNTKGIASIGELYDASWFVLGNDSTDNYKLGTSTTVDFTPASAADGVNDDREEQAMVLRWLSQVCTTRSDVFAAYIYIRGYDNGTFDADHLAEVARVLVIFDRSGIVDQNGTPRVIGYVRYK